MACFWYVLKLGEFESVQKQLKKPEKEQNIQCQLGFTLCTITAKFSWRLVATFSVSELVALHLSSPQQWHFGQLVVFFL